MKSQPLSPSLDEVRGAIVVFRSRRVILDTDLAALYGVTTSHFNRAVRRNLARFPDDFMVQLTPEEGVALRSHVVTSKGRGGRRYAPLAFTEHGAIMAATILNSPRATEVAVFVVRAFIGLREAMSANAELARRLDELEKGIEKRLESHDDAITEILRAIRALMTPPDPKRRPIGFIGPAEN
ncbi:MAG: ORF6N domain-containing protein [Pseudomonadota bacterium]|nr:ORF6N domain-containing protein [Pseudomonadota bacterium]